jgi:hypothetical protein
MANPKIEVDYKVLDALLQFKVPLYFVADYMNVSRDTIIRRLKEDYDMTFAEYHELRLMRTATKLQQKAIEMALAGNATMMIFSLKNLAGWADKVDNDIKIQSNGISITVNKDESDL